MPKFDSLLIYAYGGPEKMQDVAPFLRSVAGRKSIPLERLAEVTSHYALFNGRSPMNDAIREIMRLWKKSVPEIPVYYGTIHTQPTLKNALEMLISDGYSHPLVFTPTPFRGYRKTYDDKLAWVLSEMKKVPEIEFIPPFSESEIFLSLIKDSVEKTLKNALNFEDCSAIKLLFSVHSLPISVARYGGYEADAKSAFRSLATHFQQYDARLVWQSVSATSVPWLEPKIADEIQNVASETEKPGTFIIIPLGFPVDNMEVAYDLDVEATQVAKNLGWKVLRAPTIASNPEFINLIRAFFVQ